MPANHYSSQKHLLASRPPSHLPLLPYHGSPHTSYGNTTCMLTNCLQLQHLPSSNPPTLFIFYSPFPFLKAVAAAAAMADPKGEPQPGCEHTKHTMAAVIPLIAADNRSRLYNRYARRRGDRLRRCCNNDWLRGRVHCMGWVSRIPSHHLRGGV